MRDRGWMWPAAVVGLLVASAAGNIAFVMLATRDPSFAVERDYYEKALAWDATRAQEARNAALGWRLGASLVPAPGSSGVELAVRLTRRDGAPIEGAMVTLETFHNARAGQVIAASLAARGDGVYGALLPLSRAGLWELRFRVNRAGDVFTATMTEELVVAGTAR